MRYNPILMQKIMDEKNMEAEQARLKEEAGIDSQEVVIKKKGMRDYSILALHFLMYAAVIVLIFVGLITALNPASRQIITETFTAFIR